jgi:hypothetical protein
MLNSIQHLTKARTYEILKQVQDDKIPFYETIIFTDSHMAIPNTGS